MAHPKSATHPGNITRREQAVLLARDPNPPQSPAEYAERMGTTQVHARAILAKLYNSGILDKAQMPWNKHRSSTYLNSIRPDAVAASEEVAKWKHRAEELQSQVSKLTTESSQKGAPGREAALLSNLTRILEAAGEELVERARIQAFKPRAILSVQEEAIEETNQDLAGAAIS